METIMHVSDEQVIRKAKKEDKNEELQGEVTRA